MEDKQHNEFKDFFSRWSFWGIFLIFVSVFWYKCLEPDDTSILYFVQTILVSLLSTIGISIFVGSIFNWIIGTKNFSEYVKKKIINVLISKDYIADMDVKKKESVLMYIMRPQKTISAIYSRIDDYFKMYARKSMKLFQEQQFRSNLCLSGKAKRDQNGRVYMDYRLMYRTYVVDSKHKDLEAGFNENDLSEIKSTRVALPDQEFVQLKVTKVLKDQASSDYLRNDSVTRKVYVAVLPGEEYRNAKYLNVEQEVVEYGNDHWINYSYRSSKPTDSMSMIFECDGDLIVKDAVPYGPINSFDIKITENKKRISVVCNKWMEPGYGVNILIANESHAAPAAVEAVTSQAGANTAATQGREPV